MKAQTEKERPNHRCAEMIDCPSPRQGKKKSKTGRGIGGGHEHREFYEIQHTLQMNLNSVEFFLFLLQDIVKRSTVDVSTRTVTTRFYEQQILIQWR